MPERESDRETDAVTERHKVIIKRVKEKKSLRHWDGVEVKEKNEEREKQKDYDKLKAVQSCY